MGDRFVLNRILTSHNSITPSVGNYELFKGSPLFQIDALLGSMAAVNEMLVQRPPDGVIRVFPAAPKDRLASFVGLRLPGAVLVSAAKSATAVEWVSVRAGQPGEVALAAPWADGAVSDSPEGGLLEDGNVLRWTATPGTVYRFTPHG